MKLTNTLRLFVVMAVAVMAVAVADSAEAGIFGKLRCKLQSMQCCEPTCCEEEAACCEEPAPCCEEVVEAAPCCEEVVVEAAPCCEEAAPTCCEEAAPTCCEPTCCEGPFKKFFAKLKCNKSSCCE